jgi:WD40 repeat protein
VIFSASADMMLASWDLETGQRIRRHVGHEEVINCMDVSKRGEELLVSGSDDGYIGVSGEFYRRFGGGCVDRFKIDLGSSAKAGY